MPVTKDSIREAKSQGYSNREIIGYLNQKAKAGEIEQREADLAAIELGSEELGLIGDLREVALAPARFLFPKTTENLELGAYRVTAPMVESDKLGKYRRRLNESKRVKIPFTNQTVNTGVPGVRQFSEAAPEIGGAILLDALFGKLFNKILGAAGRRLPFGTPDTIRSGAREALEEVGKQIDEILTLSDETVNIKSVIDELLNLRGDKLKAGNEAAVGAIDDVIAQLTKNADEVGNITADTANAIKTDFGQYTFSQRTGQARAPSGTSGVEQQSRKFAGGELSDKIKRAVPAIKKPFKEYGQIADLYRGIQPGREFQGWWKGGLAGALGAPPVISSGVTTLAMPYTRFLLRKLIGGPITRSVVEPTAIAGLNRLFSPQRGRF